MRRLIFVGLLASISGCASPFNGANDALSVQERHPISVDAEVQSHNFAVTPSTFAMTQDRKDEFAAIVAEYKRYGIGRLKIAAPSGTPNAAAAVQIAAEMTEIARARGISGRDVDVAGYRAPGNAATSPLIVTYTAYKARASACGRFSSGLAFAPLNKTSPNFGCATQNNLAALVEDPGDLVAPRGEGPADQDRRATTLDKYRKGEVTAADSADKSAGAVSEVGQ